MMKQKKIYHYHIDFDDLEKEEVGKYFMSHRRPIGVGDYVVLEVYPVVPEDPTIEQLMWSQDNPPEFCVLGQVSRINDNDLFFKFVYDS